MKFDLRRRSIKITFGGFGSDIQVDMEKGLTVWGASGERRTVPWGGLMCLAEKDTIDTNIWDDWVRVHMQAVQFNQGAQVSMHCLAPHTMRWAGTCELRAASIWHFPRTLRTKSCAAPPLARLLILGVLKPCGVVVRRLLGCIHPSAAGTTASHTPEWRCMTLNTRAR